MASLTDLEAQNNNLFTRLRNAETAIEELRRLASTQIFRNLIGEEGALGARAVTDTAIAIGLLTGPIEKLHVYDGNFKVEGQGFEDVTGGTIYLQNKPSLVGASPADNDVAGNIKALAVNDAGNPIIVVDMYFQCTDVTEGSEDGAFRIVTQKDYVDAFVFNLVRDRMGINELDPQAELHVKRSTAGAAVILQGNAVGDANICFLQINDSGGTRRGVFGDAAFGDDDIYVLADTGEVKIHANGAVRARVFSGIQVGSPTGGDKGAGTINAQGVYDDNTLLTPYVLEAARNGRIDMDALDAKVPNRTLPPIMRTIPAVTRTIPARKMKVAKGVDPKTGKPTRIEEIEIPEREEIIEPEREEIVEPEREEERIHAPARRFAANMEEELDPVRYAAKWRRDGHLPAFPSEAEWEAEGKFAVGDLVQRLMETAEVQAVHIDKQQQQIVALEARLAALERPGRP